MKSLFKAHHGVGVMIICLFVALFVLTNLPAYAKNYFVDPSSRGSNVGTFSDPWRSIDAIPATVNFFLPGDTVFFKRGQSYSGTLSINSSGNNGAPVVFMPYGSGNAPLLQYNLANAAEPQPANRIIIRLNQVNYVVIDGFELTDYSVPEYDHGVTANVGYGVFIYKGQLNNGSNNIIKNLTISRLGAGIAIDGGSYNTITDCKIRNLRMMVNTAHTSWDDYGAVGIMLAGSDNIISKNNIEDCWGASFDYQYDGGAIEMYGPSSNNRILYNTAIGNLGWMEFGSHTGGQALNNVVGYNLLINNGHVCWINWGNGFTVDVQNLQFYNNNIIETSAPRLPNVTSLFGIFTTPTTPNVISLKNNIFWLTTPVNITDPVIKPFNGPQLTHQNNLYHLSGGSQGFTINSSEQNLTPGASLFADVTSFSNPVLWNYNLLPASAALDFGQSTGIDKDFYGNPVPSGNAPDAGISENILAVLPLQILSFKGWAETKGNTLEWLTTNDKADRFEVERSSDGKNFSTIAVIPHKEYTNSASLKYQFTDKEVLNETQYYRIKVIGAENTSFYSQMISVKNNVTSDKLIVTPNPVKNDLYVSIPGNDFRNKELAIVTVSGIIVKRIKTNESNSQMKLNVSSLPHGSYIIRVIDITAGKLYKSIFIK